MSEALTVIHRSQDADVPPTAGAPHYRISRRAGVVIIHGAMNPTLLLRLLSTCPGATHHHPRLATHLGAQLALGSTAALFVRLCQEGLADPDQPDGPACMDQLLSLDGLLPSSPPGSTP